MLELTPKGLLSWDFGVRNDGALVGSLELKRVRSGGTLQLNGREYELARRGFLGAFELKEAGRVIATGSRSRIFPVRYDIRTDDRQLQLKTVGLLPKTAKLLHGDVEVATIRRKRLLHREVTVELVQSSTPLPIVLFGAAIIVLYWRHRSRSSN